MMNNLFIMFDPASNNFSLNWVSLTLPFIFIPQKFWLKTSRIYIIFILFMKNIIKTLTPNLKNKTLMNNNILIVIMLIICYYNFLSLFPFIFAPTSHMVISLSLSVPLWATLFFMCWLKTPLKTLTHLVPMGAPTILCPFMVIIETISNLIRPFTLAIRLSANMIAGHILIFLLSTQLSGPWIIYQMTTYAINILIILEMAVAVIQGYVFMTLLSLYLNEI